MFVVYLACHPRPVHEVLLPEIRDIAHETVRRLKGMQTNTVELEALIDPQSRMLQALQMGVDEQKRGLLLAAARQSPAQG